MDCALPPVSDDGDQWSDNHSMESDDGFQASPPWMGPLRPQPKPISVAPTMSILYTGQLSPISDGVDAPGRAGHPPSSSSGPPAAHSAVSSSSSFSDSWGTGYDDSDDVGGMEGGEGEGDCEGGKEGERDGCWGHGSDGFMAVPKLEPMDDDDFRLEDLQEAPHTPIQTSPDGEPMRPLPSKAEKRPRGRPRKHPLTPNVATNNKVTKGRSKTGCLTCRKRKKKCDEAKPRCMNCEKNAVVCEGYPEKQIWKSGKERAAEEERMKTYSRPSITMQPIFHGLETVEDMIFWKHYNNRLSAVLTVEGEHRNAFKDFIVPVAVKHQGLMHSILSLSSRHMDFDTPYGLTVLRNNPSTSVEALRRRSEHHHEQAIKRLYQDIERHVQLPRSSAGYREILSARYGQMLCLLLESTVEGNPRGEHRVHLQAYKSLIRHSPPDCDPAFLAFFTEFFQYHIFADELLNVPEVDLDDIKSENSDDANSAPALTPALTPVKSLAREALDHQPWQPAAPMQSPRLLGVADGLFCHLTKITAIRRRIRANMRAQVDPVVDYGSLYEAAEIEAAIREWHPQWPPDDSRDRVGLLYKQMMWIYLFRTIYPPSCSPCPSPSSPPLTSSSSALSAAGQVQGSSFDANTPPHSDYTSCASSPSSPSSTIATATAGRGGGACPGTSHSNPSSRKNSASDARAAPGSSDTRARAFTSPRHTGALGLPPISTTATTIVAAAATVAATAATATAAVPAPTPAPRRAVGGATAGGRAESPAPIRQPPQQDPRITLAVEESLAVMESFERGDPVQTLLLIPCLVVGAACFAPAQRARVLRAVAVVRGYTGMRNTDRVAELLAEVWRLMDRGDWAQVWDWQAVARQQGLDFLCT